MAMNKEETMTYISELEDKLEEQREIILNRPEKIVNVINEVVVENSGVGGENLGELFTALAKCQGEFRAIGKNTSGHGYDYSNLQSIVEYSTPITSKHGLAITQQLVTKMLGNTPLSGVKTILGHSSGGFIYGEAYMPTVKTKMNSLVQMFGVNTSYLKRYGWLAACGLATTDDKTDTDGVG